MSAQQQRASVSSGGVSGGNSGGVSGGANAGVDPAVPKKAARAWRQACDRTKDRTRELLKRWRTLPESESLDPAAGGADAAAQQQDAPTGWSVHVWSTWLTRGSLDDEEEGEGSDAPATHALSAQQQAKLGHFFTHLLDWDRDDLVSAQDFDHLCERVRRFGDWSTNSAEFHVLQEVRDGFVRTFVPTSDTLGPASGTFGLDRWLSVWARILHGASDLRHFPVWMQFFAKLVFLAVNSSGSGAVSESELRAFYASFLGLDAQCVEEALPVAFASMTSNGDHALTATVFNLVFANFLLGRFPHGPGQFLFGPIEGADAYARLFPVDYSALNAPLAGREPYSPGRKSNRFSVVV